VELAGRVQEAWGLSAVYLGIAAFTAMVLLAIVALIGVTAKMKPA
jgi:hypothetical protein